MLKFITAMTVAMGLCLQPAAARLGDAHSVSETGAKAEHQDKFSLTSYIVENIKLSFSIFSGQSAKNQEGRDKHPYSYGKRECDITGTETDEEPVEGEDAKDQEPTGPEPLYFGF